MGLLYELVGEDVLEMEDIEPLNSFSPSELHTLVAMLGKSLNSPVTSSVGRLFDVVSSLLGLRQISRFEGQAAMALEFALWQVETDESYPIEVSRGRAVAEQDGSDITVSWETSHTSEGALAPVSEDAPLIVDWEPMVRWVLEDRSRGLPAGLISARFHNALVESIVAVARLVGEERVVLSGGCFQNRYLTERAVSALSDVGFRPYWHQRVPPNDGGISLGQIVAGARALKGRR